MHYEVEVKYPLADPDQFREQLLSRGATAVETIEQEDLYYNHPVRDFAQTDEALRIRRIGERNRLTFKGPLVDQETKTREEFELEFESGSTATQTLMGILQKLSFRNVHNVRKEREVYRLNHQGQEIEIVIDHVEKLGWYVELECSADEHNREQIRDLVLDLASQLGLGPHTERRSYLRLLLEQDDQE